MTATLYTDGGARGNPGPSGMAALLFDEKNKLLDFDGRFEAHYTNNQAEYGALILGLKIAIRNDVKKLQCKLDSELVVKQLNGEYKIKDSNIIKNKKEIDLLLVEFDSVSFTHVMREFNKHADRLVNLIIDATGN
jgi:ribonuclease HI